MTTFRAHSQLYANTICTMVKIPRAAHGTELDFQNIGLHRGSFSPPSLFKVEVSNVLQVHFLYHIFTPDSYKIPVDLHITPALVTAKACWWIKYIYTNIPHLAIIIKHFVQAITLGQCFLHKGSQNSTSLTHQHHFGTIAAYCSWSLLGQISHTNHPVF